MTNHKVRGFFCVLLCYSVTLTLVLGAPDKTPPNYHPLDQQSLAASTGYKVQPLDNNSNKQAKELGYGSSAANSNTNSFTAYDYAASNNNVNVNSQGQAKDSSGYASSFGPSAGPQGIPQSSGGYPAASVGDQSYGPPSYPVQSQNPVQGGPPTVATHGDGQSYAYYYQHFPGSRPNNHLSPGEESFFDGFGDLGGGIAGLGGIGGVLALAKGILAIKPFLLFGLLLLLGIPLLLLFLPIPIITVSGMGIGNNNQPTPAPGSRQYYGQGSSMISSYMSQLSERILNSEECLERILCKMPQVPGKLQGKAKILWEEYGKKYFSNARVQRAVTAYFDESTGTGRSRVSKCNQKFKCSNKFF